MRQFNLEPRDLGSDLSLLLPIFERVLVTWDMREVVEIIEDFLENCP